MTPEELLAAVRTRVRRWRSLSAVARWAWVAALAGLVLVLLARKVDAPLLEPLALAVPLLVIVALVGWAWSRNLPDLSVARVADDGLRSHDALSAYLEFRGVEYRPPFVDRITTRATQIARDADPAVAAPRPGLPRARVALALGAVLASVALVAAANPQDDVRARERGALEARDEAVAELERAAEAAGPDSDTGRALAALADSIATMTPEEALAELATREAALAATAGADLQSAAAATAGLDGSVQARPLPGAGGGDAATQLAESAASVGSMAPEQRQELAARLDALASTQTAGAPAVASALTDAAAAVRAGDPGAADALSAAADAQTAQASDLAARQSAAAAAAQVGAVRAAFSSAAKAGQGQAQAQGQGQGQGQGKGKGGRQGQGNGNGNGQGKGQGNGQGQGQGAGGSPSGQVAAGQRSGSGSGRGGAGSPGQGAGASAPGGSPEEAARQSSVFAPEPSGTPSGEGPQQGAGGGLESTTGKGDTSTSRGAARLSLGEALRRYTPGATRALDQPGLPTAQRSLISNYFERLSSQGAP